VCAAFLQLSLTQDVDLESVFDGAESVGYYNKSAGLVFQDFVQDLLHFFFVLAVQCGCGFVQDQDFGFAFVAAQSSSNG